MTFLLFIAALAAPTLAEKTGTARPALATPPAMEGCDASDLGFVVGKRPDDALQARALAASGAAGVRIFKTGEPVTQDRRSDRLNFELSPGGAIVSARCY
jgi:hypothetical protein